MQVRALVALVDLREDVGRRVGLDLLSLERGNDSPAVLGCAAEHPRLKQRAHDQKGDSASGGVALERRVIAVDGRRAAESEEEEETQATSGAKGEAQRRPHRRLFRSGCERTRDSRG